MKRKIEPIIEELAALEHEQWAHWMGYLQEKKVMDGALVTFTMEEWANWIRQASTPYKELTEKEKESDREWARKAYSKVVYCPLCGEDLQVYCPKSECGRYMRDGPEESVYVGRYGKGKFVSLQSNSSKQTTEPQP